MFYQKQQYLRKCINGLQVLDEDFNPFTAKGSSGVRQIKIYKCKLAFVAVKGLIDGHPFIPRYNQVLWTRVKQHEISVW